ncbi:MAG: metallophosphoesterase [Clostridia bacterium]|nr:metallophosphoesterase [Clostridia bacterium]
MSKMKPLYDGIKLNCTIVSDTHIDEKHPMPWLPKMRMKCALKNAKASVAPVDVFMTVGDTTSRGSEINWSMTKECFDKVPNAAKKIILPLGNHDSWNDDGYDAALNNYKKYYELICHEKREKPYFSYVVNGYHFICLATDSDSGCEAAISDEEMQWFTDEMAKAGKSGNPIFVFCHQSLNQKHGLPITWDKSEEYSTLDEGGIGERSDEIEKIMKQYKNVYYFSGHSHMGLCGENCFKKNGYASFEKEDNLNLINLPSLACGNHHGEDKSFCVGLQLEVYDDKVVIRPRNFKKHSFIKSVMIRNGKPYLEEKI